MEADEERGSSRGVIRFFLLSMEDRREGGGCAEALEASLLSHVRACARVYDPFVAPQSVSESEASGSELGERSGGEERERDGVEGLKREQWRCGGRRVSRGSRGLGRDAEKERDVESGQRESKGTRAPESRRGGLGFGLRLDGGFAMERSGAEDLMATIVVAMRVGMREGGTRSDQMQRGETSVSAQRQTHARSLVHKDDEASTNHRRSTKNAKQGNGAAGANRHTTRSRRLSRLRRAGRLEGARPSARRSERRGDPRVPAKRGSPVRAERVPPSPRSRRAPRSAQRRAPTRHDARRTTLRTTPARRWAVTRRVARPRADSVRVEPAGEAGQPIQRRSARAFAASA